MGRNGRPPVWPLWLLALPAGVAIWSGWVGLGGMTGFGVVHPLPGIADGLTMNSAITLPVGMEVYAAYALRAWLGGQAPERARAFARRSAVAALVTGAAGQIAYHLMTAAGWDEAPWPVTIAVACVPVAVLGMGAALAHLLHEPAPPTTAEPRLEPQPEPQVGHTDEPHLAMDHEPDQTLDQPVVQPSPEPPTQEPAEPVVHRPRLKVVGPRRTRAKRTAGRPDPRAGQRVLCEHCDQMVSRSTRERHLQKMAERNGTEG